MKTPLKKLSRKIHRLQLSKVRRQHPAVMPEILYRKLVEHMNEAVWMGDVNERTVYANPKFCNMLGYTLEEILGWESYDFWDAESAARVKNVNVTKRKKGVSSSYEGNLVTKDGRKIPVLLSGTPLPDGGTVGIMTDLTELKRKEAAERALGSAVQYASDGIIIFDREGYINIWNRGAKIIFGYKKEEMLGAKLDRIFSREDIQQLLKQGLGFRNFQLKGIHRNKSIMNISATLTPLVSEDKEEPAACLLIARDMTIQAKFEEEMALKYQKMKEAYNKFGILRRQLDYVFEILDLLSGSYDPKSIADFIVSSIIMLTRVDACILRLYNAKKDTLDLLAFFGVSEDWQGKASLKYHGSLTEKVVEEGQTSLKIIDVTKEPRYHSAYLAKKNNLSSFLLIPLKFKAKLVGSLSLYARPEKKLEIFENEFIEKYAKLIAAVLGTMTIN